MTTRTTLPTRAATNADLHRSCNGRLRALLVCYWLLFATISVCMATQGEAQAPFKLNLVIVEGEGAINNIRSRTAREPIVQVLDENHKPVPGAAVTFSVVTNGEAGAAFKGHTATFQSVTNTGGRAVAKGFRPNGIAGSFKINVVASLNGQTATTAIAQANVLVGGSAAAGGAVVGAGVAAHGVSAGVIAGIAGGVAAAGAVAGKVVADGGGPAPPDSPAAAIGSPGAPVFGPSGRARPAVAARAVLVPASAPGLRASGIFSRSVFNGLVLGAAAVGAVAAGEWCWGRRSAYRVGLSPGIRFRDVAVGTQGRAVFLLKNRSKSAVVIESIEEPELVHITPPAALPMVLAPGAEVVFRASFVPRVAGNTRELVKFILAGARGRSKTLIGAVEASAVEAEQ